MKSVAIDKLIGGMLRLSSIIPGRALNWLGPMLARTRPVGWFANWSFGAADDERSLLYRARLCLWSIYRYRRREASFTIDWHDGLRLVVHPGNDLSRCVYVAGNYEPNEFTFLAQTLRPSMCFIDVGANEGLYTLFAARKVSPTGKVLALEPSSREFRRLTANLELNNLSNVRALQIAASDRSGPGNLRVAGFGHEGLNSLGEFAGPIEPSAIEQVRLMPLDDLVEAEGLGHVDALKIDVEGGELAVLQGARKILAAHRPVILLELFQAALQKQNASREAVLDLLRSAGYTFRVFTPSGPPEPVREVIAEAGNIVALHPRGTGS